ncbi:MAG TPA: ribulose-phosphate 3-epimerase, partial [Candidatus Omnitrophota bacterium]|nr:ribulose-phosphate 3-epimerase [Candidatus Omnitrophota bacterium]
QKFMPEVLPKIKELAKTFQGEIAIDGGINRETAPQAVAAGASVLATASYFFGAPDLKEAVRYLKSLR